MTQNEKDENLIVVIAIEGYSQKHKISTSETIKLFKKFDVINMIRSQYGVLHTQDMDDSVAFAEAFLARRGYHG